jgi:hypothetical protein
VTRPTRPAVATAIALLTLICSLPISAFAGDIGTTPDVSAIRHDLPILLSEQLATDLPNLRIDWVVADNKRAVASWHVADRRGIVAFQKRSDVWWWRGAAVQASAKVSWTRMQAPGNEVTDCNSGASSPTPQSLLQDGFIDTQLAAAISDRLPTKPNPKTLEIVLCDPSRAHVKSSHGSPFASTFAHSGDYGFWFTLQDFVPTEWMRPAYSRGRIFYVGSLRYNHLISDDATTRLHVLPFQASMFGVWFPYVLPVKECYDLWMTGITPEIVGLRGDLESNVVRFSLPRFALKKTSTARLEIDWTCASS